MSSLELPTSARIAELYHASPFPAIIAAVLEMDSTNRGPKPIMAGLRAMHASGLLLQLDHRLVDAATAYCIALHYFNTGIPDDEWHLSPGRSGASVEYFPNFEAEHFRIKQWFDFFADAFYYKLFTAWDVVGHILNASLSLGLEPHKVTFKAAVQALRAAPNELFDALNHLVSDPYFVEGSAIRNDITHNYLPYSTGIAVSFTESRVAVGLLPYITSRRIVSSMDALLRLFSESLAAIRKPTL
jgi:hypothetical protein